MEKKVKLNVWERIVFDVGDWLADWLWLAQEKIVHKYDPENTYNRVSRSPKSNILTLGIRNEEEES